MSQAPFEQSAALSVLPSIKHGFFGRRSGTTAELELNVSETLKNTPQQASANRQRAQSAADMSTFVLASAAQIHSTKIVTLSQPPQQSERPRADGFVTELNNITIAIITADCGPLLFADAQTGVIGGCHAGWRGAVDGVIENTIDAMIAQGAKRENIVCALGPTISGSNYEVEETFATNAIERNPDTENFLFRPLDKTSLHFDLPAFIENECQKFDIKKFDSLNDCTYASPQKYFSHRYYTHNKGPQGRQVSLIGQIS